HRPGGDDPRLPHRDRHRGRAGRDHLRLQPRRGRLTGPGRGLCQAAGQLPGPLGARRVPRRRRGDAGRAAGAALVGADPPGAPDLGAAVMAAAEPEPEAERVADATATIGTDRYHVDLEAGRHALAADEPAERGEKTPGTRAVRAGTEIRTSVERA